MSRTKKLTGNRTLHVTCRHPKGECTKGCSTRTCCPGFPGGGKEPCQWGQIRVFSPEG